MQFNKYVYTHTHHLPLGVSRNPAAEDNHCSCSSLPGGLLLVGHFGLGSVALIEPLLLGTATVQQAWWSDRAELEARLLVTELLVAERCGLATAHLDSLAPSIEDLGMNPAAFSCFGLIYDDLYQ